MQFHQIVWVHRILTKVDFRLTGFLKATSRVSAGANDGEAAATHLSFSLFYEWMGLQ